MGHSVPVRDRFELLNALVSWAGHMLRFAEKFGHLCHNKGRVFYGPLL